MPTLTTNGPASTSAQDVVDARNSLVKASRALERFLPLDTPHRAEMLEAVQRVIDRLGRADEHRVCRRCQRPFVFTVALQEEWASKGWAPPRHCRHCRETRKRERSRAGNPPWVE